jgi:hypothetical protein
MRKPRSPAENARVGQTLMRTLAERDRKAAAYDKLRRPVTEREPPHCPTCACGMQPETVRESHAR